MKNYYELTKSLYGFCKDWYVFGNINHLPFTTIDRYKNIYFNMAQEKDPSIPILTIHEFRHSHASLLININIPIAIIAERLGDSIEVVLETYAHLFPQTENAIIEF